MIDHIPGIGPFRASETAEIVGVDEEQLGEFAQDVYYFNRDLEGNCTPEDLGHVSKRPAETLRPDEKMANDAATSASSDDQQPQAAPAPAPATAA